MRGSKKSREQHIRDGTYHDYHHKPIKVGDKMSELKPYKKLTEVAALFFFDIAEDLNDMGLLKPEDLRLIANLAEDWDIMNVAKDSIDEFGHVLKEPKEDDEGNIVMIPGKQNPSVNVYYKAKDSFGKIAKSLGIGPLARQKLFDNRVMGGEDDDVLNLD